MNIKRMFLIFTSCTAVLLPMQKAYAVSSYVQSSPLAQVVKTPVRDCVQRNVTEVKLITWGGDIATGYANGNSAVTKSGSIFGDLGLNLSLVREDDFRKQVEDYVACKSPYLRGTAGMINMAAEVAARDPRTELVALYQMTWSAGGDTIVVKSGINTAKDLKGKTGVVQAYGPHVDYLAKILSDAGLSMGDVKIRWVKDLTGTENTPAAAFQSDSSVDFAMVIIPDALALTSGGTVGTGSEDSVNGAKILLTTKTANRIIADQYFVRRDYFDAHRDEVQKFVHGLMRAEEALKKLFQEKENRSAEYQQMISAAADLLLDSPQATGDAEGLYADCEYAGFPGNVKFYGDSNYPRNFEKLNAEIQKSFVALGILSHTVPLAHARWDYETFKQGLTNTAGVEVPRFKQEEVARFVSKMQQKGMLEGAGRFSFEVHFQPNQNSFPVELYQTEFNAVIDRASTYAGAIVTIEGHSDPLGYLKAKKAGEAEVVLSRVKQSAKNLSYTRAHEVRDSIIAYAKKKGITLDPNQFAVVGHGITNPKNGMCGSDPCAPQTKEDWLDNMRVQFQIIPFESESEAFEVL